MDGMLSKNPEEESTRFPPIGKGVISQSMVNLSNEASQVKEKLGKKKILEKNHLKNEIIVEDHKEKL